MKKIFFLAQFLFIVSLALLVVKTRAAGTASVGATVTFQNVAVTITSGSVNYGTLGSSGSQTTYILGQSQVATNTGNASATMTITGTSTAAWGLQGTQDADKYVHKFCNGTATCSTLASYTAMTYSPINLDTNVAASSTVTFNLGIMMPTTSSSYTVQSPNVTVTISAN
jgi:hypothetical protein